MIKKTVVVSVLLNLILLGVLWFLIHSLGGFQYVWFKAKNRGITGQYQHRMDLFQQLPIQPGDIVFLGNSIIEQCEWAELLKNARVKNRGIAGDGTGGVLERLEEITRGRPAQIFLCIGINDLISHPPDRVIRNYEKIVRNILKQTPDTELVLQSILPVNNQVKNLGISNHDVTHINQAIKQLAADHHLHYVDINRLLSDENGRLKTTFTSDGIHINGEAYILWKKAIQHLVNQ